MENIKVLAISGSLRKQSTNSGLLRYAKDNAPDGIEITIADILEFPFYNSDLTETPEPVQRYFEQLKEADALLLACPEYNYSLAPALKNAIDWASREPDNALLSGKPAAIVGSGGGMGTGRSQYHLRQVCVFVNIHPLNKPEVFSNAFSGSFDEDGNLVDKKIQSLVVEQLVALQSWTKTLRSS